MSIEQLHCFIHNKGCLTLAAPQHRRARFGIIKVYSQFSSPRVRNTVTFAFVFVLLLQAYHMKTIKVGDNKTEAASLENEMEKK